MALEGHGGAADEHADVFRCSRGSTMLGQTSTDSHGVLLKRGGQVVSCGARPRCSLGFLQKPTCVLFFVFLVLIEGCSGLTKTYYAAALQCTLRSRPCRLAPVIMQSGLPPGIAERVSFQTGGQKFAGQEAEILQLWNTFKKCYNSEALAIEAVNKNSAVILPQLNSPTKIKGAYALLVRRLGKSGAADVIQKNPGILVCTPASLEKQSNEQILQAAALVAVVEENKGLVRFVAGTVWLSIVLAIVYRIITVNYGPLF